MRNRTLTLAMVSTLSVIAGALFAADGFDANGSSGLFTPYQQLSNQESVNLTNGTMIRQWTEAVVPGRSGMDLHLTRTLAAGKTEIAIEEFKGTFSGAKNDYTCQDVTDGGCDGSRLDAVVEDIRYHNKTINIPSLGVVAASSITNAGSASQNKVAFDPQLNGWDVSWAPLRGIVVMTTVSPNRPQQYRNVMLVRPGGAIEFLDPETGRSRTPGSSNVLITRLIDEKKQDVIFNKTSALVVMGEDGREYIFERKVLAEDILSYDVQFAWECGKFIFFRDTCRDVNPKPGWRIDAYVLKEVKDQSGNSIVATLPAPGANETMRLDMILAQADNSSGKTWRSIERRVFAGREEWEAPGLTEKNRLWVHTLDDQRRFTESVDPEGLKTTIQYSSKDGEKTYPIVRRLGLDYLKDPARFVQIQYPTGGLLRYEFFDTIEQGQTFLRYVIATEAPDLSNASQFYQKYFRISRMDSGEEDIPLYIQTDVNTPDGAQIHQEYSKTLGQVILAKQAWTANSRTVTADYVWSTDKEKKLVHGLKTMTVSRDGKSYTQFSGTYDPVGRLTESQDVLKNTQTYQYSVSVDSVQDALSESPTLQLVELARVLRQRYLPSSQTQAVNGKNITTHYNYGGTDSCGGPVADNVAWKISRQVGAAAVKNISERCFDAFGNVVRQISGPVAELAVTVTYDVENIIKMQEVDAAGQSTQYTIDPNTGLMKSQKAPNGSEVTYNYDNNNRLLEMKWGENSITNTYVVDGKGKTVITTTTHDAISGLNHVTMRTYDGLGFLTSIDDDGAVKTIQYDAAKRMTSVVNADGPKVALVYDGFGRLTLRNLPGLLPMKYNYALVTGSDGLPNDEISLSLGNDPTIYKSRRNLQGQLVAEVKYLNGVPQETTYQVDPLGQLTDILSPSQLVIHNDINYEAQTVARSLPGGDTVQIQDVNVFGQAEKISFGDAAGQAVNVALSYDAFYRPTVVDFPETKDEDVTMSYGAKGSNADGRLQEVVDQFGTTQFWYGASGAIEGVNRTMDGMESLKTYSRKDIYGNELSVTYPNGLSIHYIRDAKNRVTHVRKGSTTGIILAKMAYDARDNLTSVTYANGITTEYDYDLAGRVTRIASHKGEKYVLDDRYSYDALGNKISVTHQDGSKASYDYDGMNRLTQAKYFKNMAVTPYDTQEYGYDVDGNRTSYKDSIKEIQYVMESKDGTRISNRVAAYTVSQQGKPSITVQFEYAMGNLVKQTESQNGVAVLTKTFVYDPNNRLTKATVKDERTGFQTDSTYTYDYAGRREQVSVNGAKSYYGYGESLDPLVRVNEKNEIEAAYIYVGSRRLGVIEGDTLSFFHADELGNTLKTTDDTGSVTQTVRYDPFGNVNFLNGPSENRYLFAGKPYDEATGLIYFGARYYDPQLGRFITRDPVGQGFNHYVYADNNPLVNRDVFGLMYGGDDGGGITTVEVPTFETPGTPAGQGSGVTGGGGNPTAAWTVGLLFNGASALINGWVGRSILPSLDISGMTPDLENGSYASRDVIRCTPVCEDAQPIPNVVSAGRIDTLVSVTMVNVTPDSQQDSQNDPILDPVPISNGAIISPSETPSAQSVINSSATYTFWSPISNAQPGGVMNGAEAPLSKPSNYIVPVSAGSAGPSVLFGTGTPNTAGPDSKQWTPPNLGTTTVGNLTDTTDKGSPGVQDSQAQNNTKDGNNAAGDPVLLHSGDLLQSEIDLKIPGRGLDYEFRRTYRSRIQFDGPLGANWDHNYNKRLVVQDGGDIARFDGDARFDVYKFNKDDSTYTTPSGRFDVLSKLPDGTYQIRDRHGVFNRYNSAGLITSITDSNNNSLNFEYADVAGASRLTKVTDTLGRAIQYQYYTSGPATGHLQKITDFAGRTVQFTIDGNLDLVAVTSPATSDFPAGKKVQYGYSTGFAEDQAELNHNLAKVTDAKGQVVLQNTYSLFDRVLTQRLGPTGQFQFDYHPLTVVADCTTPETLAQAAYRTTVTNRAQNQTVYDFNCQGNPLTIQNFTRGVRPADPAAYVTHYTYNEDGLPTAVTYPDGNQIQLIYADVQGLPSTVAQWSVGNLMVVRRVPDAKRGGGSPIETEYQYELLYNKPVAMTDPLGNTTRIWYDYQEGLTASAIAPLLGVSVASASPLFPSGLLGIGDVNGDGVTTQLGGNVVGIDLPKAKDPDGVVQQLAMRFRYTTVGQITRMIDAAGTATDYTYQNGYLSQVTSDVGGLGITRSMTRDAVGNVTSASDGNGKVTQFDVNPLNQITKLTDPLGHFTQFNYDANNNIVQIDRQNLDETGAVANGNALATTKIDYNVLNRPTLQRSEVAEGKFVVTEFQYDANENLTRVVQPEGNSTFIQYDERDLPYQVVRGYGSADASRTAYRYNGVGKPTQIQDPLDHITTITYDGFDRPILTADALGNTAVAQYDPADQMTQVQRRGPPTVGGDVTTVLWERKTAYDELGRATGITEGTRNTKLYYNFQNQLAKQVDPQGRTSSFIYDPVGRLLQQILPNGDKSIATYDGEGRILTQTQQQTHAALGMQSFATQYAYDAAGRLTQRTTPDNAVWKYQYDSLGRLRVVVDPTDITHSNSFDDLGRLTSASDDATQTTYAWDDNSRLTSVTDAKGNKTAYTFDALNRRTQVQFADGSVQSVIYSAVSQPTQINLPNGFAVNLAYDAGNQLLSRIIAKDNANTGKEVFGYDGLGRMITGKVLDVNGATQDDLALQFDDQSALLQATQNAQTIKSKFTAGGDRQSVTYPGGIDIALTRDSVGRLTKLAEGSLGELQTTTYAGGMRPYQMANLNGTAAMLAYDAGARINNLSWAKGATSLAQHAYSYNALSNITLDNTPSNVGDLYQYDTQGRLTLASQKVPNAPNFVGKTPAQFGAQYAYAYDAVSNWTQQTAKPANTTTAYTANALNQYTQADTADLKYDKNGNLTQDETFTYAYDWRNLITEVRTTADNAVVAQYRYDALGRRVAKVDGLSGDVTRYVLDGWNVVEERDDSGAVAASYVYDERGLPIAMQRSGKLYFYHYNHLGSIESVTNSDGDVVEQYRYDPFGGVTVADGAGNALPSSQIDNPFFFAGQWRDSESGLYYMRHRYYSASLGRFTSRDPLEYVDGLNAYAYAMSNPVNFSDPLGLSTSAGAFNTGAGNPTGFGFNTNSPALYLLGQASADTLKFGGGFAVGGVETVLGWVKGAIYNMTPLGQYATVSAIYNYDQTWAAIKAGFANALNTAQYGSSYEQGKLVGKVAANFFGGEFVGGAIGKVAEGLGTFGKVGGGAFDDIMSQVTHADFSTPNNGAVFWTGYQQGNKATAMQWAAENGKYTIEMTPGGKWLEGLDLYGGASSVSRSQADMIWQAASGEFSWGASGHANAFTFGTEFSQTATFYGKELPILRQNPNVNPKITYRGY